MTYSEKLKDPRWQRKRLELFELRQWACETCEDKTQTLHAHHMTYIKGRDPWEYRNDELKCICDECHRAITVVEKILAGRSDNKSVNEVAYEFKTRLAMLLALNQDTESTIASFEYLDSMIGFIDHPAMCAHNRIGLSLREFSEWVHDGFIVWNRKERHSATASSPTKGMASPIEVFLAVAAVGGQLAPAGDNLRTFLPADCPPELKAAIRQHKAGLLELLQLIKRTAV